MKTLILCAGTLVLAAASVAMAAENSVISLPGLEIRADGSISAPGVEIGPTSDKQTPSVVVGGKKDGTAAVVVDGSGKVQTPGVVIEPGSSGEGGVNITSEGGNINTSVSNQNLYLKGDKNTLNGSGQVLTLTIDGHNNKVELHGTVERIVYKGDKNFVKFPKGNTQIEDLGKDNTYQRK